MQCAKKIQNDWYIRINEESKNWLSSLFVTLTYNEESVPITTDDKGNIYRSVCRDDIQLFMKRLRKACCAKYGDDFRLKYFMCSEYGPKTFRPHYHGIIFNLTKNDITLIEKSWNLGFVSCSVCRTAGSFRYVSKYCSKPAVLKYENFAPVERTFRLVSHGLGKSYADDSEVRKFHLSDIYGHHYYFAGGFKYGLPRYLCGKLFTNQQQLEYKRLKELDELKQWRFRFSSYSQLDGRTICESTPFQLAKAQQEDYIKNYMQSCGDDLVYYQKFMSNSIF